MGQSELSISSNKRKILNDPVYGFITIPNALIYDLVEHPSFQRLRRIKQVGMSHLVYPGANHTRFHHAIGAMHLMQLAISSLKEKGVAISNEETNGALVAILLHDIGHGPFSHSLEYALVKNVSHEDISGLMMERLNDEFNGQLTLGISIFKGTYHKKFLHQLVSSQLDMDRMDYLNRDSFYTGVSEGVISNQRIIKMLDVKDDKLVVEEKGIYSIEKFIVARRLMYWQVYLHKTVVSAERLLINILTRAKECVHNGATLFGSPTLQFFLNNDYTLADFKSNPEVLDTFMNMDDYDIMGAIKVWATNDDWILSKLCAAIVNRKLPKVVLSSQPFPKKEIERIREDLKTKHGVNEGEMHYFIQTDTIENHAYNHKMGGIFILKKSGALIDLVEASDNQGLLSQTAAVKKHVLYRPKTV